MIAPQKLFRHRTQNEIPATCAVGICSAWYWLNGMETPAPLLRRGVLRSTSHTIFGG